jgi:hypothetical protein
MTVDGATAAGYWKQRYGELENTVPEFSVLAKEIPFQKRKRLGQSFEFPVRLRRAHGVTFASGANSLTAFTLNAVRSGQMKRATVEGSSMVARESFAYKAVVAAMDSQQAFGNLFDEGVRDLYTTSAFYLEASLLYGNDGWGSFAVAGGAAASQSLALTAASSAPGLWAQMAGSQVDVYQNNTWGAKRNTQPINLTGMTYDQATGQVTLNLTETAAGDLNLIQANDIVVPVGYANNSMSGLSRIAATAGPIFGIDNTVYPSWAMSTYDCGAAAATFGKITRAAVNIMVRDGMQDVTVYVSTATWTDINNNAAALRRLNEASARVEFGAKDVVYHGPSGRIKITAHPMVKGGEAYMGDPKENAIRIGATDLTFNLGISGQNQRFLRELSDSAGFEIRCMWDQGIILPRPRGWVQLTNIVNS